MSKNKNIKTRTTYHFKWKYDFGNDVNIAKYSTLKNALNGWIYFAGYNTTYKICSEIYSEKTTMNLLDQSFKTEIYSYSLSELVRGRKEHNNKS